MQQKTLLVNKSLTHYQLLHLEQGSWDVVAFQGDDIDDLTLKFIFSWIQKAKLPLTVRFLSPVGTYTLSRFLEHLPFFPTIERFVFPGDMTATQLSICLSYFSSNNLLDILLFEGNMPPILLHMIVDKNLSLDKSCEGFISVREIVDEKCLRIAISDFYLAIKKHYKKENRQLYKPALRIIRHCDLIREKGNKEDLPLLYDVITETRRFLEKVAEKSLSEEEAEQYQSLMVTVAEKYPGTYQRDYSTLKQLMAGFLSLGLVASGIAVTVVAPGIAAPVGLGLLLGGVATLMRASLFRPPRKFVEDVEEYQKQLVARAA